MKISTRGRYGLRALIDLALTSSGNCVPLSDISARQDLSLNYLESIFSYLKRSGLVVGVAGSQGGYILTRPAGEIRLLDILTVLEGDMSIYDTIGEQTKIRDFLNRSVWDVIDNNVTEVLMQTTLEDILKEVEAQQISGDCSNL